MRMFVNCFMILKNRLSTKQQQKVCSYVYSYIRYHITGVATTCKKYGGDWRTGDNEYNLIIKYKKMQPIL